MELFRLCAHAITPQRTAEEPTPLAGGPVAITDDLRGIINEALALTAHEATISVDFRVDVSTRTNVMRDTIIRFAFADDDQSNLDARSLATHLANAMDRRSPACLFVCAAFRAKASRGVALWTFPRDEAFQFEHTRRRPSIRLLTDVFSRTSRLRKAALYEGHQRRTDFLSSRVLDFQVSSITREVADFWISRFLDSSLAIRGDTGTKLLAKSIRDAFDTVRTDDEREQIYSAIMAIRQSPRYRWSLRDFAETFLSGNAKETFLKSVGEVPYLESTFDFQRDTFEQVINFRVFRLERNVFVSSPFDEIGRSVIISEGDRKLLRCEGTIIEEKVRSRNVR